MVTTSCSLCHQAMLLPTNGCLEPNHIPSLLGLCPIVTKPIMHLVIDSDVSFCGIKQGNPGHEEMNNAS